jgi:hypothetical protein
VPYPYNWSAEPLNLLSPEIVAAVKEALGAGIVCGLQFFYCGGQGPEPCAFADLNSCLSAVEKRRPGDVFTLWSVPALTEQGALLLRKQAAPAGEVELRKIQDWPNADPGREFLAVGYLGNGAPPETTWGDSDWFDRLEDLAHRCAPAGEFAALPLTDLVEEGNLWIPRLHLVNAKRPNERGEVPLGGAY